MLLQNLSRHFKYSSWAWRRIVFWCGAVTVALAAIAFAYATVAASLLFRAITTASPYLVLLVMPLGMGLVLMLTRTYFAGAEGSGIPQTIAALELGESSPQRDAVLSLKIAGGKILLTVLALCAGASVGREGPTVQIGAAIMHAIGRLLKIPGKEVLRGLILAGAGAGIAAAFNTPLAGIVFAIEELSRSFEARTNGIVLTGVILAGITSLAVIGNYHYFGHTSAGLDFGRAWLAVGACGIVGGLVGGGFSQTLILAVRHGLPGGLGRWHRRHPAKFAAACGAVLAVVGLLSGGTTYGTGYGEAQILLHGGHLPVDFALMKLLSTAISYLSGIPGGIFAPTLATGAGLGADIAILLPSSPAEAVILLGMVGYFSGVVQAPITAVVIVLELTDNSEMTLPLMATAIVAFALSRLLCPEPFYKALAQNFLAKEATPAVLSSAG